jgi:cell division protein FtsL
MELAVPKFENTLSLGNLLIALQLAGMLVALGVVWGNTAGALSAASDDRATIKAQAADQEARIRVLERDVTSGLARIETQLRVLSDKQERTGR